MLARDIAIQRFSFVNEKVKHYSRGSISDWFRLKLNPLGERHVYYAREIDQMSQTFSGTRESIKTNGGEKEEKYIFNFLRKN